MPRDFDGTADYMRGAFTAPTPPFTMGLWFNSDSVTVDQTIMGLRLTTNYWTMGLGGTTTTPVADPCFLAANATAGLPTAEAIALTGTGYSANTWHYLCGRIYDDNGTQYAVPDAPDTDNGGVGNWVETNGDGDGAAWQELDDGFVAGAGHLGAPDDDTTAWNSPGNPVNEAIECEITGLIDPSGNTGHTITIRARKNNNAGREIDLVFELIQLSTVIGGGSASNIPNTYADYTYTLSSTEADNISDYADLRLRVTANVAGTGGGRACILTAMQFECPGGNSRDISLDGGTAVLNQVSKSPTGNDFMEIGATNNSASQPLNGEAAWATVWDSALSDDEITALANGVHPTKIRPHDILACYPVWGIHSPEIDLFGANSLTLTSAPPLSSGGPPIEIWRPRSTGFVSSLGAGADSITALDATHGHTADLPTLSQNHNLSALDATHSHTTDAVTLSQNHNLSALDATHSHTTDAVALAVTHNLVALDATHGHTTDAVALAVTHNLVALDATHGHTTDLPAFIEAKALTALDATHGHTTDLPAFIEAKSLTALDATHGHTTDLPAFIEAKTLTALDATHGHTTDLPAFIEAKSLTALDATHGHTTDLPAFIEAKTLVALDATHGHTTDLPALTEGAGAVLAALDATHGHTTDAVVLAVTHNLVVLDATHGHTTDAVALAVTHNLVSLDATHGHTTDLPAFIEAKSLVSLDATHGHTTDAVAFVEAKTLVALDATHGHTTDAVALTVTHNLVSLDATHGHTTDAVAFVEAKSLTALDATHGHTADVVEFAGGAQTLVSLDATHSHVADAAAFSQLGTLPGVGRKVIVADFSRTITVASVGRTVPAANNSRVITVAAR